MAPLKGEENTSPNIRMTRIKCPLFYDSSSTPIPIQLDLVTPAVILELIPQIDTIRESDLFRDVDAFIGRHFASQEIVKESNYFDKMVLNGVLYAKFVYYFASSYDKQAYFAMLHTWWWLLDDWIDMCALKSEMGKLEIIDIIEKFIRGGGNQEETIRTCSDPLLRAILEGYSECDAMVAGIVSDYPNVKYRFTRELILYLHSGAWALMDSSLAGSGYSFDTFLHWRKISGGADGSNELLMLLENGNPPKSMLDHLMVKALFNTSSTLFALRNDLVGVKRDLARNDAGGTVMVEGSEPTIPSTYDDLVTMCRRRKTLFYTSSTLGALRNDIIGTKVDMARNDNSSTVMYKILVEGKSAPAAVQEIMSLHEKITRDYVQLRQAILTLFKNCGKENYMKLENYIELLERYELMATVFYFSTPRYLLDGNKFELEHIK
ncbi:(-)-delta-cadinene synthase [Folsomia candida]|uniref:(-)-delta-cadinene synthase n=1 Tax=Folsomia candida TaxID=158441 RepID=A0A226D7X1_FOLCA|nr:(-)-delta-cadinene synthase [Folsomia candida]